MAEPEAGRALSLAGVEREVTGLPVPAPGVRGRGRVIVGTLNNGGNLLAINSFYLQIIIGALILAAVAFDQWQGRRVRSA